MYKIATNTIEFDLINQAAKDKDITGSTERYCDIIKHCKDELYAIPVIQDVLKCYKLPFITDTWFYTGVIENISTEWTWHHPERTTRISMPTNMYVDAQKEYLIDDRASYLYPLGALIEAIRNIVAEYSLVSENLVLVYLESLEPDDKRLLQNYNWIKIDD